MGVPLDQIPTAEELGEPDLDIWPEHWHGLQLFLRLASQWRRAGMEGAIVGLDYGPLGFWLEIDEVPRAEWPEAVDTLQVLERQVLQLAGDARPAAR